MGYGASVHRVWPCGFGLKEGLKPFLAYLGYAVEDLGNLDYDKDDDYPDFALKVALNARKRGKGVIEKIGNIEDGMEGNATIGKCETKAII